jgi:hypothetical protein
VLLAEAIVVVAETVGHTKTLPIWRLESIDAGSSDTA